ncbi:hypothetical protein WQQ_22250 [Hydrocarboniphaga effusa AP103]|uniref:Uncharacterized protein n=2 Tax=Nevskiaceae TaxID=568386 RepID=I8TEH0_9GAMM|nr:hypothetical protein WQQ_22250 [Hydrocarboniphaga effusa AP103]
MYCSDKMQNADATVEDALQNLQGCDPAPSQEPWLQLLLIPLALATLLLFAAHGGGSDERVSRGELPSVAPVAAVTHNG